MGSNTFLPSLHLYLITMSRRLIYGVLLFINKTVARPCIASRQASISCRGSEDEMDVVECQEDKFFSKNVEKNLLHWRTGPYH